MNFFKNTLISIMLIVCLVSSYRLIFYSWNKGHTFAVGNVIHKTYDYDTNNFYVTLDNCIKYNVDKETYINSNLGQETVIPVQNDIYFPLFLISIIAYFFAFIFSCYFFARWD